MSIQIEGEHLQKKGIVLTARVHPGETNSSYMMKGALDFLLSNSKEASIIRKHYVVRLIPMLNPDGVIYGNYRCSLLGVDLNRRWDAPSRFMHPTIYHAKRFIQNFSETHEIALYCDMHGHSMRKNVFMYACNSGYSPSNVLIRLIPRMLGKLNPIFSFKDCHFRVENCKLSTARVVLFREINVINSYTLEASFYGPENRTQLGETGDGDAQMTTDHMETLGSDLCRVMAAFVTRKAFKRRLLETVNRPVSPETPPVPSPHIQSFPPVFPTLDSDNEEDFWTKVSDFETKAYQVLYHQHTPVVKPTPEEGKLDLKTTIETISEAGNMPEELLAPDVNSDEGGSDDLGSDNDDNKQAFLYRKSKPRKSSVRQKRQPVPRSRSCIRPEPRPRTPFVFGNYSRPPTRCAKAGKDLSLDSPNAVRLSTDSIQPSKMLLSGFKRVRMSRPPRPAPVSYCPSTLALSESKETDSALRSVPWRWLERKGKTRSRRAHISPV